MKPWKHARTCPKKKIVKNASCSLWEWTMVMTPTILNISNINAIVIAQSQAAKKEGKREGKKVLRHRLLPNQKETVKIAFVTREARKEGMTMEARKEGMAMEARKEGMAMEARKEGEGKRAIVVNPFVLHPNHRNNPTLPIHPAHHPHLLRRPHAARRPPHLLRHPHAAL